jgi:hypothetical protein
MQCSELSQISPFTHVPKLPGGTFSAVPLAWLAAVAVLLAAAGLAGLRRRDIGRPENLHRAISGPPAVASGQPCG